MHQPPSLIAKPAPYLSSAYTQKYFTGATGDRTRDVLHTDPPLYALSHQASRRQRREKSNAFDIINNGDFSVI